MATEQDPEFGERLAFAYKRALRYLRRPYVTGIAMGEPMKSNAFQPGEVAICIHLQEKMPLSVLRKDQVFPAEIEGIRLDIVERDFKVRALPDDERLARQLLPASPASPGVQVGVHGHGAGTFGLVVHDRLDGSPCLLSAAHVLDGPAQTDVFQPGSRNRALPIGSIVRSMLDRHGDAAIARLDRMRAIDPVPLGLQVPIRGIRTARQNDVLVKSGAETGVTKGIVSKVGQFEIRYRDRKTVTMEGFELRPVDPTVSSEISDGGDSGSIWYDEATGEGVGLTVGGDANGPADPDEFVLACHLECVFSRLMISLDPDDRAG